MVGGRQVNIAILGPGCMNCHKVEAIAKAAAEEVAVEATFQHITSMAEITQYPILRTPGLVINGQLVMSGRIPTKAEVIAWIRTAAEAAKEQKA